MSADPVKSAPETAAPEAATARHIARAAVKATLATLESPSGAPYASLVAVATTPDGRPVLAMSSLAHHRANIDKDPRVSLLFDGTPSRGDPLVGGRVTVSGRAVAAEGEIAHHRFRARHPDAFYTDFGDFGFFVVEIEKVHFVAGFGRVRWFRPDGFLVDDSLAAAEADILSHMNADHGDAVRAYATGLLGAAAADWRMTGIDVEGADLVADGVALRLDFPAPVASPGEVRTTLVELAAKARR